MECFHACICLQLRVNTCDAHKNTRVSSLTRTCRQHIAQKDHSLFYDIKCVPFFPQPHHTQTHTLRLPPTLCLKLLFRPPFFVPFWCPCDVASLFLLDKIHTGREEEAEWDDEGIDREKERKRWRVEEKKKDSHACSLPL